MISRATCPTCEAAFQVSDDQLGQTIACARCHTMFHLPPIAETPIGTLRPAPAPMRGWLIGGLAAGIALVIGLAGGAVIGMRLLKPDEAPRAAETPTTQREGAPVSSDAGRDVRSDDVTATARPGSTPPSDGAAVPHDPPPLTDPPKTTPSSPAPVPQAWSDLLKDTEILNSLRIDFPGVADPAQQLALLRGSYPGATPDIVRRLYQVKDNSVLPRRAIKGRAFTYQLPRVDGAQYELLSSTANGPMISPDGVISWPQSLTTAAGTYDLRWSLKPGAIARTIKIELIEDPESMLALPRIGGWAILADGSTLICSLPDQAQLVYIDTAANKELKRVGVPFKPELLAVQGKRLFVSVQNAGIVHVLDVDSGESKKAIVIAGGGVAEMVCHPDHGLVFIATPNSDRLAYIDPAALEAGLTAAPVKVVGLNPAIASAYPAIDATHPDTLYVAYQAHNRAINIPGLSPNDTLLAKYLVVGKALQLVEMSAGVAQHGYVVRVSHDGKQVAVSGGAGLISAGAGSYKADRVGLFSADKLTSVSGVIECGAHPGDLAFHPALDVGVLEQDSAPYSVRTGHRTYEQVTPDQHLHLFNSKTLVEIANITLTGNAFAPEQAGRLLTFGARGTKLLYYDRAQGYLRSFPLSLSDADKTALAKAYGAKGK
jgi:predicted Zn finger-like uncharacterized protein